VTQLSETGPFERMLTVSIPPEALEAGKRTAAARLAKEAKVKGFRPGKAPLRVVESLVGAEVLRKEAIDDALPAVLTTALEAADLMPAVPPRLTEVRDGGATVEVDLLVTLWPTVTEVPEYAGMKVEVEIPEVTDADVTNQVERMREQFAELDDVSREGFDGDLVLVDVTTTLDGADYAAGSAKDMMYEIGSGAFLEGMDEALRGAAKGSIVAFDSRLPEGIGAAGGRPVKVRALVKQVKAKRLPVLTDEWVNEVSEFETITEMRAELAKQMNEIRLRSAWRHVEDQALERLVGTLEVTLPPALIEGEMDSIFHRFAHRLEEQGVRLEQYLALTGQDEKGFVTDLRSQAELNLKIRLLLEGVADQEGISVERPELEEAITALAAVARVSRDDYAAALAEGGRELALAGDILRRKAIDRILDLVVPVDAAGAEVTLPIRSERASTEAETGDDTAQADPAADDGQEPAEVEE
jgi:trigger factor